MPAVWEIALVHCSVPHSHFTYPQDTYYTPVFILLIYTHTHTCSFLVDVVHCYLGRGEFPTILPGRKEEGGKERAICWKKTLYSVVTYTYSCPEWNIQWGSVLAFGTHTFIPTLPAYVHPCLLTAVIHLECVALQRPAG